MDSTYTSHAVRTQLINSRSTAQSCMCREIQEGPKALHTLAAVAHTNPPDMRPPTAAGGWRRRLDGSQPPRPATAVSSTTRWRHTPDKEFFREAQPVGPATVQTADWPGGSHEAVAHGRPRVRPGLPGAADPIGTAPDVQIQPPLEILAPGTRSGARWSVSLQRRRRGSCGSIYSAPSWLLQRHGAGARRSSSRLASPPPPPPSSEGRGKSSLVEPGQPYDRARRRSQTDTTRAHGALLLLRTRQLATANRIIAAVHLRAPDARTRRRDGYEAAAPSSSSQRSPSATKAQRGPARGPGGGARAPAGGGSVEEQ